jgi:hypothetical protein
MIISPEAIIFLVLGKKLNSNAFTKIAKSQAVFQESDRTLMKNFNNALLGKHRPSASTFKNFKEFFLRFDKKNIVGCHRIFDEFIYEDLFDKIDLSSNKLNLDYLHSGYKVLFECADMNISFISDEVSNVFITLNKLSFLLEQGKNECDIFNALSSDDILSQLDVFNGIKIELQGAEIAHNKFNFNLVLYLQACLDLQGNGTENAVMHDFFEMLNSDSEFLYSPFYYYVEILRSLSEKSGEKKSFENIAELLNIKDVKTLYRYRMGKRDVPATLINKILSYGGLLYFCICFWVNLMGILSKENVDQSKIINEFELYSKYLKIAHMRLEQYESHVQTI